MFNNGIELHRKLYPLINAVVLNDRTELCVCVSVCVHRIIMKHCITNADYVESLNEFMLHALVKLKAKRKKTANSDFKLMALHYYLFCLIGHLIWGYFISLSTIGAQKFHSALKNVDNMY